MNVEQLPSFRQFDYRIRPNKNTERRMFSEAFRRLSVFGPVGSYKYIGFGSTTFADFILFHKALNITDMVSIEKRTEYESRFEFNKPFDCIQMKYGDSNQVLPRISWDKRTIVWLDYDGQLTDSVLRDVAFVSAKARSGSVLIITVNAYGYKSPRRTSYKKAEQIMLERFRRDSGLETLPKDIRGKHLEGTEMAKTYRRLVVDCIKQALRDRNGLSSDQSKMEYQSLFNFVYKDGAMMLTVGVIFYETGDKIILQQCQFEGLDYVTSENDALYEIKVPVMTLRERHYLDQRLPRGACNEALNIGLTEDEIGSYVRLYRHCPSFAEVELS